ncbi:hypothetical protein [Kitasatospora sp. NPDC097643]|uniref:hypothetical protein n=1 Tax=Kitasatospora sp. NPDC097643 TaxID=3157230 RepID=UPI00331CF10C
MSTAAHPAGNPARRRLGLRRAAAPAPAPPPADLHRVGPHFVIAPGGGGEGADPAAPPAELSAALGRLTPVARTVTVLAAAPDAPAVLFARLDELARTAATRDATALVLAASGLAAAAPDGGPRPAQRIAELAGLGVVAPDGLVTLRPDGTLLTTGPADGDDASWWLCTPAGELRRLGPRWPLPTAPAPHTPAPHTPDRPITAGPEHPTDPLVTALPHGYWLRTEPAPDGPPDALTRATADDATVLLIVGHPGSPLPPAAELAARIRPLLPDASAEPLLSTPWAGTGALTALAAGLAAELGRDVRAAVGLPMRTAAGHSARLLTADGAPAWEPWLTELTATADPGPEPGPDSGRGRIVASAWRTTPDGPASCGPACYRAPVPDWCLEAVPAGLWLRPDGPVRDRGPRLRDPDPARPLLLVGTDGAELPPAVLTALDELLAALTEPDAPTPEPLLLGTAPARESTTTEEPPPTARLLTPDPNADPDADPQLPAPATESASESATTEEPPPPARLLTPGPSADPGPGRPSTPAERAAFRALLGEHFQRCASRAEQVAMRLPALRSHARDDLKSDLAAVYLHHVDTGVPVPRGELVEAARRGAPGPLDPYLACLGSGLRRLPNHRGAVLLGADAGEEELRHYAPGALLVEPAPVVGTPAAEVVPGTSVEFLVWSATGRRTSVVAEDGEPEVVFPPGSHFSVLAVLPAAEDRPTRVLLRELGPAPDRAPDRDAQARERLLGWQSRRDLLPPDQLRPPTRPARLHLTPGVTTTR